MKTPINDSGQGNMEVESADPKRGIPEEATRMEVDLFGIMGFMVVGAAAWELVEVYWLGG